MENCTLRLRCNNERVLRLIAPAALLVVVCARGYCQARPMELPVRCVVRVPGTDGLSPYKQWSDDEHCLCATSRGVFRVNAATKTVRVGAWADVPYWRRPTFGTPEAGDGRDVTIGSGPDAHYVAIHALEAQYLARVIPHIPLGFTVVSIAGISGSGPIAFLVAKAWSNTQSQRDTLVAGLRAKSVEFRLYVLAGDPNMPSYVGSIYGPADTERARYELDWLPGKRDVSFFLNDRLWVVPITLIEKSIIGNSRPPKSVRSTCR